MIISLYCRIMLRINITWRDRRVEYLNLRDDIYQNMVPDDEANQIWIPEIGMIMMSHLYCIVLFQNMILGFDNAKTGKLEKDEHFALMVRRDSLPEVFDPSRHREDNVYEGYKNSLMYLRRFGFTRCYI